MTLSELKERLIQVDEVTLLEMLDLSSFELVYCLSDYIEEKQDELIEMVSELDDLNYPFEQEE